MLFFYATKLRNVTNTKWYLLQMENIAKRNRVSPNGETLIQKQTHTDKELSMFSKWRRAKIKCEFFSYPY
nr:MAG TPA: hypothetical protein [Caudoviricetes sp.]